MDFGADHLGAQGGFLSHADAEFHPSLDVGLALRGLRWEIRQVDFHGQNRLLSEIAMRELIDAQGREFAAETLRQRLQIHLVAFLHLSPQRQFQGLDINPQLARQQDTIGRQQLLMRMAHGGDDALTQAPKVHDLRDYDVEVRHLLRMKSRGHHWRQQLHKSSFLRHQAAVGRHDLAADVAHQGHRLAEPDLGAFQGCAQSQQSNATASVQHPHASPKLGCLLLDGRFQGSLVHVQTLQIRHHEEMIWQNREGCTKFAVGWCLHPHRRFNRHGALLHHPEGESGSDGDQHFDDITREKSCFSCQVVDGLLPLRPLGLAILAILAVLASG
mmetsp:Transcript_37760/g.81156  ORF Transcript_37760/g.81156 Transcript_37760/m.81156 type:complete len:329 (-) Transcript_37760:1071-2057(-)